MSYSTDISAISKAFEAARYHIGHLEREWMEAIHDAKGIGRIDPKQWEDLARNTTLFCADTDVSVAFLLEATRLAPGLVDVGLHPEWLNKMADMAADFVNQGRYGDSNRTLLLELSIGIHGR